MLRKIKQKKGPSWVEVGLGAALSVLLGLVLGVALLAARPVEKVTAVPKDAPANSVYYIEGARDFGRESVVEDKRKRFIAGESIALEEGEMNVFLGAATAPAAPPPAPAAKPGDKPAAPASDKVLDVGQLNSRIHDGRIQFAAPVTVSLFGVSASLIVQTIGTFNRRGSEFTYDPDAIYVGGCPFIRVPILRELVLSHLLFTKPVPNDLYAAWTKLAAVSIDGNTLHLRMP